MKDRASIPVYARTIFRVLWVSALTSLTVVVSLLRSEYLSLLEVIFTIDLTQKSRKFMNK